MGTSTLSKRRMILAVVVGALTVVPVAQAESGFDGSPDAFERAAAAEQSQQVDSRFDGSPDAVARAIAAQQALQSAAFDSREHAQLAISTPGPDLVERAIRAHERSTGPDLSGMPDVFMRTLAAGKIEYTPGETTVTGFNWQDFGLGAGAGVGLMLLLGGLGIGLWAGRAGQRQVSNA